MADNDIPPTGTNDPEALLIETLTGVHQSFLNYCTYREKLRQDLEHLSESIGPLTDQINQCVETIFIIRSQLRDSFTETTESVQASVDGLMVALDASGATLEEAAAELTSGMDELADTASQTVESQIVGPLSVQISMVDTAINERVSKDLISGRLPELVTQMTDDDLIELRCIIDESIHRLADIVDAFTNTIVSENDRSNRDRSHNTDEHRDLEHLLEPVKSALDGVRNLAGSVGVTI